MPAHTRLMRILVPHRLLPSEHAEMRDCVLEAISETGLTSKLIVLKEWPQAAGLA